MASNPEYKPTESSSYPKLVLNAIGKNFLLNGEMIPVLLGVDMVVRKGEFVSIIGPSGCGKSTILNIIAGLEEPTNGSICVDGEESLSRLGDIGYMNQKDLLLPWRTVLDNAILGLEIHGETKSAGRALALDLIESFGLKGFEKNYPYVLSGGMRQRTAFLRTVLADHEVILLDEPFGALDALTRANMHAWILEQWEFWGKTVILVTHDVEEAVLLSDRVYVLTERPGMVKMVLSVDSPRPRRYEAVTDDNFVKMKARIIDSLRSSDVTMGTGDDRNDISSCMGGQ